MKQVKSFRPMLLSTFSKKITNRIFKERGFKEAKIINEWENVVGKEISDYTTPIGLSKNKNLKILTDSSFALELQHITPKILNRINLTMGYKAVERIHIIQTAKTNDKVDSTYKRQKLSEKQTIKLVNMIESINNKKIKEKFKNLSETIFFKKTNNS